MDKCISVIVPIYNASKTLERCLDSICHQTLRDIEIVCVNDGSTDSSKTMLMDYAVRDNRIKVIDQPNAGYGAAMNAGISAATGEFIGIVEPDDYIEKDTFSTLYRAACRFGADIVKADYWADDGDGNFRRADVLAGLPCNLPVNAWDDDTMLLRQPCIWSAIYKMEMLEKHGIGFNETPGASFQDTAFAFQALISADKVVFLDDAFLHYIITEESSVSDGGKVFAVCDELHLMEAFLNSDRRYRKRFSAALNVLRFDTYWWNYHRISNPTMKEEFRSLALLELKRARYEGLLDLEKFDDNRKHLLDTFENL